MRTPSRALPLVAVLAISAAPLTLVAAPAMADTGFAPSAVSAMPANGGLSIEWTPGASATSAGVTSYTASVVGGTSASCTSAVGAVPANTCVIEGLANGQVYTVDVVAHGSGGDSTAATVGPSIDTAPTEVPGVPSAVSTTVGNSQIGVSWTAPADNTFNPAYPTSSYAVQGYDATSGSPVSGATCTTSATSCTVSGLTNGTSYVFAVAAKNDIGSGPAGVAASVAPANVPDVQPQLAIPAVVPGDGQATINVSAALADTLSTSFAVVANPGSQSCTVARVGTSLASCVVTGLTNG